MNEVLGFYRHYKGGKYQVLGIALHTEEQYELVIYKDTWTNKIYARPKDMFFSDVEITDEESGEVTDTVKRFTKL